MYYFLKLLWPRFPLLELRPGMGEIIDLDGVRLISFLEGVFVN